MSSYSPTIDSFCKSCGAFASPLLAECPQCGWQRPSHDVLPAPGMPLWKTELSAPVRGNALIAGNLVLFAWGEREGTGGVTALEQTSGHAQWQVKLPHLPESGLVFCGTKVLCTTTGFLNSGAELIALNVADGNIAWRQPLSAGGHTQPATSDEHIVYAAADDGIIRAFDLETSAPISGFHAQMPRGKTWLVNLRSQLIVLCECGEIHLLAPDTGAPALTKPLMVDGIINSPPTISKKHLYFGLSDGRLVEFDFYQRKIKTFAAFEQRITCAPGLMEENLYVGSNDRRLRAYHSVHRTLLWHQTFEHSPTTSPVFYAGLVFCGVNDGRLHVLDASSGEPAWQFCFSEIKPDRNTPVLCAPACQNGLVFIGSDDGCAYALPWHLGQFEWAAKHLEGRGEISQAADFYAISAGRVTGDLRRKQEFNRKAVELWRQAGSPDRSAYYLAAQIEEGQRGIADQFREAGLGLASLQPEKAAGLLRRAMEYYEELEDAALANECSRMAAQIFRAPHLHLRLIASPAQWMAREKQGIALRVRNQGNSTAQNIRLSLGGSLEHRVLLELDPVPPGEEFEVYLPLIAAGQGTGRLQTEIRCQDAQNRTWINSRAWEMTILASRPGIMIEGSVAALLLYEQTLQQDIHIKGDVGLLKVSASNDETVPLLRVDHDEIIEEKKCPECGKLTRNGKFCDQCGIQL